MSRIVEIYPDAESMRLQVAARRKFGWESNVRINDRGVYEVTFTRDDSKETNRRLKGLEDDFLQCSMAADYIERYNEVQADKKKFKAFSTIVLVILIYVLFQFAVLAVVSCGISLVYDTNPDIIYDLEMSVTVGEESKPLTPDWQDTLDLQEIGLSGVASLFGIEPVLTLTVDVIMDALMGLGIAGAAGFALILIFMIRKASTARTFYKAEVEYLRRRKEMLNARAQELEDKMDEIMWQVERVTAGY